MGAFTHDVIAAALREREVTLTNLGRKSGKPNRVTIWVATDGKRIFIRSGEGLGRQWPQNMLAQGEGELHVGKLRVRFKPRQITEPAEARSVSQLYRDKYGPYVIPSKPTEPLTPGEVATFELIPT